MSALWAAESASEATSTLQWAGIAISAVAASAAIISAVISAFLTAHRERNTWLRQRQTEAYEQLHLSVAPAINNLTTGVTARALRDNYFPNIDAGYEDGVEVIAPALASINRMAVVGGEYTAEASSQFFSNYHSLLALLSPASGAIHPPALQQRRDAMECLVALHVDMVRAMRLDQKLVPKWRTFGYSRGLAHSRVRRFSFNRARQSISGEKAASLTRRISPSDSYTFLARWRVRTWHQELPDSESSYVISPPAPLAALAEQARGHLDGPAVAVLAKATDRPWIFAVIKPLEAAAVSKIMSDVAEIVRTAARETETLYGGDASYDNQTVDGAGNVIVERLWFWGDGPRLRS